MKLPPMVVADGRQSAAHGVLIALIAITAMVFVGLVVYIGPTSAPVLVLPWAVVALPWFLAAYWRTRIKRLRNVALLMLLIGVVAFIVAVADVSKVPLVSAVFVGLCATLPLYVSTRAILNLYTVGSGAARPIARGRDFAVVAIATAACAAWAFPELRDEHLPYRRSDYAFTARHAGCYALAYDGRERFGSPRFVNDRVRLDTVFGRDIAYADTSGLAQFHRHMEHNELVIRPGFRYGAYWRPVDADNMALHWTNGYVGLHAALRSDGDGYRGVMYSTTDFRTGFPDPRRAVRAARVDCATIPFDSARLIP